MTDKLNAILLPVVEKAHEVLDDIIHEARVAWHAVKDVITNGAHAMVVAAAQTNFGTTMANLIEQLWSKTASGGDKMDALVQAAISLGEKVLGGLNWTTVFSSVGAFVRSVAQLVYAGIAKRMGELSAPGKPA